MDSGSEEIVQCTYFILDANAVIQVCARGYVSVTGHLEGQRSSSQRNELGKNLNGPKALSGTFCKHSVLFYIPNLYSVRLQTCCFIMNLVP